MHQKVRRRTGVLSGLKAALRAHRLGELLVLKGLITPQELRCALQEQERSRKPLGQVFLESAVLSKRELTWVLGKQYVLKTCAAFLLFFMSVTYSGERRARAADSVADVPAKLMLANVTPEFMKVSVYPALYGTSEKRSSDLKAFTKWTGMFERFERELENQKSAEVIRGWQRQLEDFRGGSIENMARKVNAFVNETRYILDSKNWGQSDYWATPVEFLQRGGDCEDFAIAKYTALRALGVPEERLRVAIVQDTYKNIPHAVLVVYTESGAVILDNQNKTLVPAESGTRYRPIFSINRQAWWLHGNEDNATRVASAK